MNHVGGGTTHTVTTGTLLFVTCGRSTERRMIRISGGVLRHTLICVGRVASRRNKGMNLYRSFTRGFLPRCSGIAGRTV